jgi:hypothetical protein
MDYSRTEATPPHPYIKVKEVAHEVVVNYYEPTQPNPSYNEADAVRNVSAAFMDNSDLEIET